MGVGNWEDVSWGRGVGEIWKEKEMGGLWEVGRRIAGSRPTALGPDRAET